MDFDIKWMLQSIVDKKWLNWVIKKVNPRWNHVYMTMEKNEWWQITEMTMSLKKLKEYQTWNQWTSVSTPQSQQYSNPAIWQTIRNWTEVKKHYENDDEDDQIWEFMSEQEFPVHVYWNMDGTLNLDVRNTQFLNVPRQYTQDVLKYYEENIDDSVFSKKIELATIASILWVKVPKKKPKRKKTAKKVKPSIYEVYVQTWEWFISTLMSLQQELFG